MTDTTGSALRVDRWLWCARFFKTRSVAAQAVRGGHVRVNGQRAKSAKEVRIGDRLDIAKGSVDFEVIVTGLPSRRGPASEATLCYRETDLSRQRREEREGAKRAISAVLRAPTTGRPDKRTRRLLRARARDRS